MKEPNSSLPARIVGPTQLNEVLRLFTQRSDLTYRSIQDVRFHSLDLYQSLFTGSLLRSVVFEDVIFRRSDLDGMRIENCTFLRCNFQNCDIRSNHIAASHFQDCDLSHILLDDCFFSDCQIQNCSFQHAVQSGNVFSHCTLANNALSPGTLLHNRFSDCAFRDVVLGDCSFLYSIVTNCSFHNVKINAESIGMTYGLSERDLRNMDLIYLGKEEPMPAGYDIVDLLLAEYEQRGWGVGVMTMRLNFALTSVVATISDYLSASATQVAYSRVTKGDELRYLLAVLTELKRERRLPLMSAIQVAEWMIDREKREEAAPNEPQEPILPSWQLVKNSLALLLQELVDWFDAEHVSLPDDGRDRQVTLTLAFRTRPSVPIESLMNETASVSGLPTGGSTRSLWTEEGSFVEVLSTTLFSVLGLQLLLFLLNGCVIQITELKARLSVLRRRKLPATYLEAALVPRQQTPEAISSAVRHLVAYARGLSWIRDPSLAGLETTNVLSAQIEESSASTKE